MLEEDTSRSLRKEFTADADTSGGGYIESSSSSYNGRTNVGAKKSLFSSDASSVQQQSNNGARITVFELDSRGQDMDQEEMSETDMRGTKLGGGPLYHEAPWYERLYRRRCCLCTSFILLFFFFWYVTATNNACRAKMSPPHASNRAFSSDTFLLHMSDDGLISHTSSAILGMHPNQELRFLVVGNFGRDGFCYQTDVAEEMDKAARTSKASFIINTGNAFFPGGLVSE